MFERAIGKDEGFAESRGRSMGFLCNSELLNENKCEYFGVSTVFFSPFNIFLGDVDCVSCTLFQLISIVASAHSLMFCGLIWYIILHSGNQLCFMFFLRRIY